MSIPQHLLDLGELFNFSDLSTFTQNIPVEWVASALDLSSQATIRRRRLPADQVLWLVQGMALFRVEPVHEVARRLNICAQGLATEHLLARSGVTEARKRVGSDPVEWLLRKIGNQWGAKRYRDDAWQGLQLFAVDGALLRTPDTRELRDHFGSGSTSTERQTPFPMLRLVALMNVRSHVILDAQLSRYRRSEMRLADEFLPQIPDHSVTLFDKGFWSAELMLNLSGQGINRHWLTPARKNLVSKEVIRYGKNDLLVRMKVSQQERKRNADLPTHWDVREVSYEVQGNLKTVATSLPAAIYSSKAAAKLYQERWEIELGFRDINSSMQQNHVAQQENRLGVSEGLGLAVGLQHDSTGGESSGFGLWSGVTGHPVQTRLSVHCR